VKVVIVNQHLHDVVGGSELQCDIIASHLTKFGHEVVYLAVNGKSAFYNTSYPVVPIEKTNPRQIYQLLDDIRPSVVYWRYNKKGLLLAALAAKFTGSKFIFSMSHINDSQPFVYSGQTIFAGNSGQKGKHYWRSVLSDFVRLRPLRSFFNYIAVPLFADGVVSNNADYLRKMRHKHRIAIHNSMPMPVDAPNFDWPRPYIIWVANIKSRKNPHIYLELAKALADTEIDFLMAGKIQDSSYSYLATAGEECPNFHFLGTKSPVSINGMLRKSLFLVHTCNPEGFSNIFIQAWLQAKPTISLYFDPEGVIEKEQIGFLSRTFSQLVEQTRFLIEHESERTAMGQRAQQFATKQFDAEVNVRCLENFLIDVISVKEEKR
jgi:glycosyltransferase involved in cell wall biosynthesis